METLAGSGRGAEGLSVKDLIGELVEAGGPPGREDEVRRLIRRRIAGKAEEIRVTSMGSLHAVVNKGGGTRLMLASPMDRTGLVISHVDERGFARFRALGALEANASIGHSVRFDGGIIGVIGAERPDDKSKALTLDQLYLDFGSTSRSDCPVQVGGIGTFDGTLLELGRCLAGRGLDDRVGVAILIETLHRLGRTPHELWFAFTVQEEVGARGAVTSAHALDPEVAIAVGSVPASGQPPGSQSRPEMGRGPAIGIRDSSMVFDRRMVDLMARRAEQARIPYQRAVLESGTQEARAIQMARAGVPTGGLSVPCRHSGTSSAMVDMHDLENAVRLLHQIAGKPLRLAE